MTCINPAARSLCALLALMLVGCNAHYTVPGPGADMGLFGLESIDAGELRQMTDSTIESRLSRRPLAQFPTNVAVARVQGPGYHSHTTNSYGRGRYSIVTTRDIETDAHLERLQSLAFVSGIAPMNRLVTPANLESEFDLREAAASLHAQVILIYTIDTTFNHIDRPQPLNMIAVGLLPNREIEITTTASAVLMDTRSGYLYGVAEATEQAQRFASGWTDEKKADDARKTAETKAFDKLLIEIEHTWNDVVQQYASSR